ncbi:MAG: CocE/NonD family hydrolase [Candidatus Helarchaeota archaeon]
MGKDKEDVFDPRDVEWIPDLLRVLKSKSLNKILEFFMPKVRKTMPYFQMSLLKLGKIFFSRILRFFGLEPPIYDVVRLKEHLITLQDGAKLATDVYLPRPIFKERYKAPTLLIRLPYWKDMVSILGYLFASMGYVTVLQDTRGCAHSKPYGTNTFLMYEGIDGLQTVQWITKRFWYNGKIGMWGMSYFGITQLAIAALLTDEMKGLVTCMNPGMASYHNILYHPYGLIPAGMGASIYNVFSGITKNYELESPMDMFEDKRMISDRLAKYPLLNLYNEKIGEPSWVLHFNDLSQLEDPLEIIPVINKKLGLNLKVNQEDTGEFSKLLRYTAYERKLNPQSLLFPHGLGFDFKPKVPMLWVAGWYDMFQEEFIRDLKAIQQAAPEYFKKDFKVIIGPWGHGGMDNAFNTKGGTKFNLNGRGLVEMARYFMPMWYFRYFLKEGREDISRIPPLRIFILNRRIWRTFNIWPPETEELKLYLHSDGGANSRFGDGILRSEPPGDEPNDNYIFDPSNPIVTLGGRHLFFVSGPHDQIKVENRKDVLVYTSNTLTEGIEIIGEVKIVLYASSTAKDTDFMAKLVDVFPRGKKAINIIDDGIRARFRKGDMENPSLIEPKKVYQYEFSLGHTAIYFPKGHRIRLEIASSNYPRFDINSNLGGEPHEKGYISAEQAVFHNSTHPSHLILPVFKRE